MVVGETGAVSTCVAWPPSDHERKPNVAPLIVCGLCALTVLADPTMTVRTNGVGAASAPNATLSPDGNVSTVTLTVCGCSTTDAVALRPAASVTVSESSSDDGYS